MTADEWQRCPYPAVVLAELSRVRAPRKRRLFACACCRRIWPLLTDERSRQAVEVAERFADGQATEAERAAAWHAARRASLELNGAIMRVPLPERTAPWKRWKAALAAEHASAPSGTASAREAAADASFESLEQIAQERRAQSDLVRCLFANPLLPAPVPGRGTLAWNDGQVGRVAWAIAEENAFDRLGVLGDALEEAGCTDQQMLAHCRGPGPHVRGCWVVDLVTGR